MEPKEVGDSDALKVMQHLDGCETQKNLAENIGYSVGKVNYILKALSGKGLVKMENFITSDTKRKYRYLLTKAGIREKIRLTEAFIERKKAEYEQLQRELERDRRQLGEETPS